MALGGGTYLVQNKTLPGTYINFVSRPRALGSLGERGVVAMMLLLDWGKEGEKFIVESGDFEKDALEIFGYSYTDDALIFIREAFRGAKSLVLFRPEGGEKAAATIGDLTVTANNSGERGNAIKIIVEENVDEDDYFDVTTLIGEDNIKVDSQTVSDISELENNEFVTFSGEGNFEASAGTSLSGGTNKNIVGNDYSIFLDKIEAADFTVLCYAGEDDITKSLFTSFTKRLRNDEGYKFATVLHDYEKADFEGVISVKNSVKHENPAGLVYWVAGQSAGAQVNQSLTNKVYDGELTIETAYKKSEFEKFIINGQLAFYSKKGIVKVLDDINTFTSIEPYKNRDFSNNQIIRILDEIANGIARIFDAYYLGKVQNSPTGRDLFKMELINFHNQLQGLDAITNFKAEDIVITKGVEKGDVVVTEDVEPVGAMTKVYMRTTVI